MQLETVCDAMHTSVRELHLMRYGATTSQLRRGITDGPPPPPNRAEMTALVDRLHKSTPLHRRHSLYASEDGTDRLTSDVHSAYRSRQHRDSPATSNINSLFPSLFEGAGNLSGAIDTVHTEKRSDPFRSQVAKEAPSYPVDWRCNPAAASSASPVARDEPLRWLYLCFTLPLLPSYQLVTTETLSAIDRLMQNHNVPAVKGSTRRKEVRNMLRDPRRFGLLIDIISTRRTVMAGTPHAAATAIYRHCEEHYPIYLKFVFVGITDNGTKRVARDVFSGGRVPANTFGGGHRQHTRGRSSFIQSSKPSSANASNTLTVSSASTGGKSLPFSAIDSVHCFVAHPKGDEADALREKGEFERVKKEEERIARRFTPKYSPPPPPDWFVRLQESQPKHISRRQRAFAHYNDISMPTKRPMHQEESNDFPTYDLTVPSQGIREDESNVSGMLLLEQGDGQWLYGKAFAESDIETRLGASVRECPRENATVGDHLGLNAGPEEAKRDTPHIPETRDQHYLLVAQKISQRLQARVPKGTRPTLM